MENKLGYREGWSVIRLEKIAVAGAFAESFFVVEAFGRARSQDVFMRVYSFGVECVPKRLWPLGRTQCWPISAGQEGHFTSRAGFARQDCLQALHERPWM